MSPRLIFVGAPGSGKTTIGKKVSAKLGLEFIDIDQEIEMDEKISISEIFVQKGEEYFRKLEKEKIASHERLEGAKIGAQATQHKQKAESDKVVQGIKLGMEAEFKKKEFSLREKENTQPKE